MFNIQESSNLTKNINSIRVVNSFDIEKIVEVSCILNTVISLTGLIGNIICIIVFTQKRMRSKKMNFFMLISAIFEFIFCLILSIDYSFRFIHPGKIFFHGLHKYIEKITDFLVHTIDSNLIAFTLISSIERLKAIKNPINVVPTRNQLKISKYSMFYSFLISSFIELASFSLCFKYDYISNFQISYCILTKPIIFTIIPTLIILAVNTLLIGELVRYFKNKSTERQILFTRISSAHRRPTEDELVVRVCRINSGPELSEARILRIKRESNDKPLKDKNAIIIIAISIWIVATTIPYCVSNSLYSLSNFDSFELYLNVESIIKSHVITTVFFNSNHCINFFIYLFFSSEFRSFFCS